MKKLLLVTLAFLAVLAAPIVAPTPVTFAQDVQQELIDQSECESESVVNCVTKCPDPAAPGASLAENADECQNTEPCETTNCNLINKYVNPIIQALGILTGISVVIGIMYGGILYSSSGGDPQKAANARRIIRNAVLALLAFFFLYAFLRFLFPGEGLLVR